MKCENIFCVYWRGRECLLDNITLDIQGKCECCVYVDIDDNVLREQRKKQLKNNDFSVAEKDF